MSMTVYVIYVNNCFISYNPDSETIRFVKEIIILTLKQMTGSIWNPPQMGTLPNTHWMAKSHGLDSSET